MKASLDTNVLLRFALKDVPGQFTQALALMSRAGATFVVADAAWVELAYALQHHYHMDRAAVTDIVTSLMSIDSIQTNQSVIEATCAAFLDHTKLSFTDCYLAERAVADSATPLLTFDEKSANQHQAVSLVPAART